MPSSASAFMSTSGQSSASASFSSPRKSGSSSAMTAVGRLIGNLDDRLRTVTARWLEYKGSPATVEGVQAALDDVELVAFGDRSEALTTIGDLHAQLGSCAACGNADRA